MEVEVVMRRRGRRGRGVKRRGRKGRGVGRRGKRSSRLGAFMVLVVRGRQAVRLPMVETRHRDPRPHSSR